jgi:hypothetical protein
MRIKLKVYDLSHLVLNCQSRITRLIHRAEIYILKESLTGEDGQKVINQDEKRQIKN